MGKIKIHLVSNAHLDPQWLWDWEEGAGEAMSTFRAAVSFCEEYGDFVFNHNEAILYEWVEEYDPESFEQIRKLVEQGKWRIMGGWFLQPDCNMPSGEGIIRQIQYGRKYFKEKFNSEPATAVNFDPFGHSRGLVQILAKSGFDSYLFCRPQNGNCTLRSDRFIWEGYDGSRILGTRSFGPYLSAPGKAGEKIEDYIETYPDRPCGLVLWGVGNHGGGPTRTDLKVIAELREKYPDLEIIHSDPDAYFAELKKLPDLPVFSGSLNTWAVGCYTSQIRIKQTYRKLENELFSTEKMLSAAWANGLLQKYPEAELQPAEKDMLWAQFHDILPGTSVAQVEESGLRLMNHALEILSRLKTRAFFALTTREQGQRGSMIPVFVYNPHPYSIKTHVECEFMLPHWNQDDCYYDITVFDNGKKVPSQVERELCNMAMEWRKRVIIDAELPPCQVTRFDCRLDKTRARLPIKIKPKAGKISFKNKRIEVLINSQTGLLDRYRVDGKELLKPGACRLLVMHDDEDSWGMRTDKFQKRAGSLKLLSAKRAAAVSGISAGALAPVRVIEDGLVRFVVEALFGYENSAVCLRYVIPKNGTEIRLDVRVLWNEKSRMLKLSLPTAFRSPEAIADTIFGREPIPSDGREWPMQKWAAVCDKSKDLAFTVINDGIYGSNCKNGELRLSMLRAPAYAAHPIEDNPLCAQDRFTSRIDQGEKSFRFWLNGGNSKDRMEKINFEALARNEAPMTLSYIPGGKGNEVTPLATVNDPAVVATAVKKADTDDFLILRLFESSGKKRTATVKVMENISKQITFKPFEIRTFKIDLKNFTCDETMI